MVRQPVAPPRTLNMPRAARKLAATVRDTKKHILRLIELRDDHSARVEIDHLLRSPDVSASLATLLNGVRAHLDGDNVTALERLDATLALDPANAFAHYWIADIHAREGRIPEAVASLSRAFEIEPQMAESWFLYGGLALQGRNVNVAINSLLTAIEHDVDNTRYWAQLNHWLPRLAVHGPMSVERRLLTQALQRQKVDLSALEQVLYAVLKETGSVQQLAALDRAGALVVQLRSGEAIPLLADEFLLLVLLRTTLFHADYEQLLTQLRRGLLAAAVAGTVPGPLRETALRCAAALAVYALGCEFVLYASAAEEQDLAACRKRLEGLPAQDPELPLLAAMLGCYGLLARESHGTVLRAMHCPANRLREFREMVRQHMIDPMMLEGYAASVQSFGHISNDVSRAVRQQYEENPYPRWRSLGETHAETFDNRISRQLPHLGYDQRPGLQALLDQPLQALIAGCGTGRQALWFARQHPGSRILGVDLSRASLAYALMKAEDLGIGNVEFLQADILELPSLGRQFDVIESVGVLHHMEDPARGLAALAACLRPGGWMKIALYSLLARQSVREARRLIAAGGFEPTAADIRRFRHAIVADPTHPLHGPCTDWRDFFSLSECRDLLFHVQEHQFTTAELATLIAGAGLEFMGFERPAGEAPAAIADPRSLAQWDALEQSDPRLFGSMYVMWLRRPA